MEIQGEDGSKFALQSDSNAVFGRGNGFRTEDKTVSRKHLSFRFRSQADPRVSFEVLGKNPAWVLSRSDGEIRVFRKSEEAELVGGERFCVSGKMPVWFSIIEIEFPENLGSRSELESIDVSSIDPVKEFGFLAIGHEFDCYPKQRIRDIQNWNWFLEEDKEGSDDEENDDVSEKKKRKRVQRKKNGNGDDDDDDWTDESEDDKELANKSLKIDEPRTRSMARNKYPKDTKYGADSRKKSASTSCIDSEEEEEEEEDDETLGGFIISDEDSDPEEEIEEEGSEEDEFVEDEEMDD